MEETYTLSLALYDFAPVTFFLIGAIFLTMIATRMCGARCRRLAIAGSLLIFMGGFLKAVWKLLVALGVGDFQLMSEIQFVLVAPGFFALLIVVIWMGRSERTKTPAETALMPAIAVWKIPFLIVMTLTSMGTMGILTYLSFQRNTRPAAAGYIVAFLCLVGLGAMASGEQTIARQWIEQTVNTVGQLGFMVGGFYLYRNVAGSRN